MLSHVGICRANVETILVVVVLAVVAWHASSHISRYCNGVARKHNTQYQTILHTFPVLTDGAYTRKGQLASRVIK